MAGKIIGMDFYLKNRLILPSSTILDAIRRKMGSIIVDIRNYCGILRSPQRLISAIRSFVLPKALAAAASRRSFLPIFFPLSSLFGLLR